MNMRVIIGVSTLLMPVNQRLKHNPEIVPANIESFVEFFILESSGSLVIVINMIAIIETIIPNQVSLESVLLSTNIEKIRGKTNCNIAASGATIEILPFAKP